MIGSVSNQTPSPVISANSLTQASAKETLLANKDPSVKTEAKSLFSALNMSAFEFKPVLEELQKLQSELDPENAPDFSTLFAGFQDQDLVALMERNILLTAKMYDFTFKKDPEALDASQYERTGKAGSYQPATDIFLNDLDKVFQFDENTPDPMLTYLNKGDLSRVGCASPNAIRDHLVDKYGINYDENKELAALQKLYASSRVDSTQKDDRDAYLREAHVDEQLIFLQNGILSQNIFSNKNYSAHSAVHVGMTFSQVFNGTLDDSGFFQDIAADDQTKIRSAID